MTWDLVRADTSGCYNEQQRYAEYDGHGSEIGQQSSNTSAGIHNRLERRRVRRLAFDSEGRNGLSALSSLSMIMQRYLLLWDFERRFSRLYFGNVTGVTRPNGGGLSSSRTHSRAWFQVVRR